MQEEEQDKQEAQVVMTITRGNIPHRPTIIPLQADCFCQAEQGFFAM